MDFYSFFNAFKIGKFQFFPQQLRKVLSRLLVISKEQISIFSSTMARGFFIISKE